MTNEIAVEEDIKTSTALQKLIEETGNQPAKYVFDTTAITINSLLRVYNDTEWDMKGCTLTLMKDAPLKTFGLQIPIIAPKYPSSAKNLIFRNGIFYGNRDYQSKVPGWCGHSGKESKKQQGQGYHNFFMGGVLNDVAYSNTTNCTFENLEFYENLGDGIRIEGGQDITVKNIKGRRGGHDIVCIAAAKNVDVSGVVADLSVNAGVRFRSVKGGAIHDCKLNGGTKIAYCPGIQVQSTADNWTCTDVTVYNNYIHDTYGPGIWVAGSVPGNDITIKNNIFEKCGQMPKANEIPGVGAIVTDGFDTTIEYNTIVDSYGYGVLMGKYAMASSVKGIVKISKNIITGTRKALYPASTNAAIANLTNGRYKVSASSNCFNGNVLNSSGVTLANDNILKDPLFVGSGDYHLQSESPCPTWGRYGNTQEEAPIEEDEIKLLISCQDCDVNNIVKSIPYSYEIYRGA